MTLQFLKVAPPKTENAVLLLFKLPTKSYPSQSIVGLLITTKILKALPPDGSQPEKSRELPNTVFVSIVKGRVSHVTSVCVRTWNTLVGSEEGPEEGEDE